MVLPISALACTNPAGIAGDMTYNKNHRVMQWCDGTNWNAIGKSTYVPNAVNFDGTNDYISHNAAPTGATATKQITFSGWIKIHDTAPLNFLLEADDTNGNDRFTLRPTGASPYEEYRFTAANSSNTLILDAVPATPVFTDGDWHHIMFSADLSNPANRHYYVDGISQPVIYNVYADDFIDVPNITDINIGSNTSGASLINGDLADLWLDFGTYIDLSIPANRERFIKNGWPADLGSDGSLATGAVPDIFLSGDTATWHTNKGTGGGFTENGALTDTLSSPGENLGPLDGLIGWWKFDDTSGTAATDSSGNGNDGSFVFMSLPADSIDGVIDTSFNFEDNRFVRIFHNASLLTPPELTIATWIKFNEDNIQRIVTKGSNSQDIQFEYGSGFLRLKQEAGANLINFAYTPTYGEWVHVAASFDDPNDEAKLYIDGVLVNTNTTTDSFTQSTGVMSFSGQGTTDTLALDDMRYYNRVLSDAEVTELYNSGMPCQNPAASRDGDMVYNTTHNVLQYCNLREWKAMSASPGDGGAGCTNPTGVAGDTVYNSTSNVMTYCEGDTWRAIGAY